MLIEDFLKEAHYWREGSGIWLLSIYNGYDYAHLTYTVEQIKAISLYNDLCPGQSLIDYHFVNTPKGLFYFTPSGKLEKEIINYETYSVEEMFQ